MSKELQEDLHAPKDKPAQSFGAEEFTRRVARRAGIDEPAAQMAAAAVLATIRDAVSPGEFDDVLSQLGRQYTALMGTASSATSEPTSAPPTAGT